MSQLLSASGARCFAHTVVFPNNPLRCCYPLTDLPKVTLLVNGTVRVLNQAVCLQTLYSNSEADTLKCHSYPLTGNLPIFPFVYFTLSSHHLSSS